MIEPMKGNPVVHIATGRIGIASAELGNSWLVSFRDKSLLHPELVAIPTEELDRVILPEVKGSEIKRVVRGTLDVRELTDNFLIIGEISEKSKYKIKAADLLYGIKNLLVAFELEKVADYCLFVCSLLYEILPSPEYDDRFEEREVIEYCVGLMNQIFVKILENPLLVNIEEAIRFFELIEKDLKDYIDEGIIPDAVYGSFLGKTDADEACLEGDAYMTKYKFALEYLCAKDDPQAIKTRGYCYYTGNKMYKQDFYKSRDAFLKYYSMTGSATAANTLGYIYYYGRCNGGKPQYDEAFKYFSIGHAAGLFESTYKLADMFARGYYIVQNGRIAMDLYWSVYNECFEQIRRENYDSKFADIALRMGNCYMQGIGVEEDYETGYAYYLQAKFAIEKRMQELDYYGDDVVYKSVRSAITKAREKYKKHDTKVVFGGPQWVLWLGMGERNCTIKLAPFPDGSIMIEGKMLSNSKDRDGIPPKIMVVIPPADYCALKNKIMVKTAPGSTYEIFGEPDKMVFNNVTYNDAEGVSTFWLDGIPVGRITTKYYEISAPLPAETDAHKGKKHRFVSVVFDGSKRKYDYLCTDKTVKPGDQVMVSGYDGDTIVTVTDVFERYEDELPIPIKKYKKAKKI